MSGSLATAVDTMASNYAAWWAPIDPLPTLLPAAQHEFRLGAGAALTIQGPKFLLVNHIILNSWIPPDPLPIIPVTLGKNILATKSGPVIPRPPTPSGGNITPPQHVSPSGAVPVYIVPNNVYGATVPLPALGAQILVAGSAIIALTGPVSGGYITNPPNAASQAITTAENAYVDMVYPPGSTDATANGTTTLLAPGQTFTIPTLGAGVNVYVNAATAGHKLTVVVW